MTPPPHSHTHTDTFTKSLTTNLNGINGIVVTGLKMIIDGNVAKTNANQLTRDHLKHGWFLNKLLLQLIVKTLLVLTYLLFLPCSILFRFSNCLEECIFQFKGEVFKANLQFKSLSLRPV